MKPNIIAWSQKIARAFNSWNNENNYCLLQLNHVLGDKGYSTILLIVKVRIYIKKNILNGTKIHM